MAGLAEGAKVARIEPELGRLRDGDDVVDLGRGGDNATAQARAAQRLALQHVATQTQPRLIVATLDAAATCAVVGTITVPPVLHLPLLVRALVSLAIARASGHQGTAARV